MISQLQPQGFLGYIYLMCAIDSHAMARMFPLVGSFSNSRDSPWLLSAYCTVCQILTQSPLDGRNSQKLGSTPPASAIDDDHPILEREQPVSYLAVKAVPHGSRVGFRNCRM